MKKSEIKEIKKKYELIKTTENIGIQKLKEVLNKFENMSIEEYNELYKQLEKKTNNEGYIIICSIGNSENDKRKS
jgi:hypothetical protein